MKRPGLLAALALILASTIGCASVNVRAEKLTHDAIVANEQLHETHAISDTTFKRVAANLYKVAVAGDHVTAVERTVNGSAPTVAWGAFAQAVVTAAADIVALDATSGTFKTVLAKLNGLAALLEGK